MKSQEARDLGPSAIAQGVLWESPRSAQLVTSRLISHEDDGAADEASQ